MVVHHKLQRRLLHKPFFNKPKESFMSHHFDHRTEGQNFDQKLCLRFLIIVDQALVSIFIKLAGAFLVIGKLQHRALQSVAAVLDDDTHRFVVAGTL